MAKIIVLSTVHNIKDTRIFYKEIQSLKKVYRDISFIVSSENKEVFFKNDVKIFPLPIPKSKFQRIKNQNLVWKIIKKQKPDVVHFHDPELILLGFFLKKLLRIKVIFDIHENVSASFKDNLWIPQIVKPFLPKIYKSVEKLLIKDFDALIIAETSYKKNYGERAVEILNYPILHNETKVEKDFSGRINLVYVGGIWKRRGALKMLELLRRLVKDDMDVYLYLVGPFVPFELKTEVEEFISKYNLSNYIKIFGRVELDVVYKILRKSHLGLSLMQNIGNYKNSLSTKIFEYMLHSVPYIVSNFPIYEEYTQKHETGITVDYENDDEIFTEVKKLIADKEKMDKLGNNGFESVKAFWNWKTEEERLFSVYAKIIKSGK